MAGALSRAAIADRLTLDRKSLTNLANSLIKDGWLKEGRTKKVPRGRPITPLELDKNKHLTIGIQISETQLDAVLVNLYGQLVYKQIVKKYPENFTFSQLGRIVNETAGELGEVAGKRLHSAGLVAPGIIDMKHGRMLRSVNMPMLNGVDLSSMLENMPRTPAIEEASRAKALAEKWFGIGQKYSSFVCVDLGIGIGAGIILNHHLHDAPHSGEIGHMVIRNYGRDCLCGHKGCLEAYLSERVLCNELSETENISLASLADLHDLTERSMVILREAGYCLGLGLAGLVNILCPPLIVLTGNLTRFKGNIFPEMERGLVDAALPSCRKNVTVRVSNFTPGMAGALGAAAAAMKNIFQVEDSIHNDSDQILLTS